MHVDKGVCEERTGRAGRRRVSIHVAPRTRDGPVPVRGPPTLGEGLRRCRQNVGSGETTVRDPCSDRERVLKRFSILREVFEDTGTSSVVQDGPGAVSYTIVSDWSRSSLSIPESSRGNHTCFYKDTDLYKNFMFHLTLISVYKI